jgi:hypothetical protein
MIRCIGDIIYETMMTVLLLQVFSLVIKRHYTHELDYLVWNEMNTWPSVVNHLGYLAEP